MDIGTYRCGPYPKWKYHATETPRFITSEYDDKALPEGWFDQYQKQDWPKLKYSSEGEVRTVANPDEESQLEGTWSDTAPEQPEGTPLNWNNRTLEQIAQQAKSKRRQALDYEQLNDELELKADNTAMKPLRTGANPQPEYHDVNTPAVDKRNKATEESARKK
jgi:hypothetical protein